jgi:uncharacterized protein (DUF1800 family)
LAQLTEHTDVLDKRLTKHLLRRACFHYSKQQLEANVGKTASEILQSLATPKSFTWPWPYDVIKNGPNSQCPDTTDGSWLENPNWTSSLYSCGQNRKRGLVAGWWWFNALKQNTLIDKLTWFLFTTFTLSKDDGSGRSAHFFDYLNLLQFYADKSVKDLAKKITFDNSMLYYLDNKDNNKNSPNENYAREFLELFTIGKGEQIADGDYTNYTEHDVVQAARVFSGVKLKPNRDHYDTDTVKSPHYPNGLPTGYINVGKHDTDAKTFSHAFAAHTISGGNDTNSIEAELDNFVEMVFSQSATAVNYVRKLYRMYVRSEWGQDVEEGIITPLAEQLMSNGYNVQEVLLTLLKSKHFFDLDDSDSSNENIGGIIKNPLQYLTEMTQLLGVEVPDATVAPPPPGDPYNQSTYYYFHQFWMFFAHNSFFPATGMELFAPSTVAGYAGDYQAPSYDRSWFNSNTIIARYNTIMSFIGGEYSDGNGNGNNQIVGIQTTANGGKYYQRIRTNFSSVDFVANSISDPFDPNKVVNEIAELLYCESIDTSRLAYFKLFLVPQGQPDYYWYEAWSNYVDHGDMTQVKLRLDQLVAKMVNAAEFQLM